MKKIYCLILVSIVATYAVGQEKSNKELKREDRNRKVNERVRLAEEGVLVFDKHSLFGIQAKTNGLGVYYEYGKMKTNTRALLFRADITEIRDLKEEKLNNNTLFSNSYKYGKINSFYPVSFGVGQQHILGQKGNKNGVAVAAMYYGGLSAGLLRPYYLNVVTGSGTGFIKYTPADSAVFLDHSAILGGGGIGRGWKELKVKPGAFVKGALRFDYGKFNEAVSAIEVGAGVDVFASKIPLLLYQKDKQLFYHAYVAIVMGKRK